MREISYNREAAVAYARRWALGRNPAYFDFEKLGGDCTNFASQCIYAGARVMNYKTVMGWYYRSSSDRTPSWSGVEYLNNFLTNNRSVGPYARVVSENEVQPGDIVQLGTAGGDYYHSPVVTVVKPTILLAAIRFIHIDGVRIW